MTAALLDAHGVSAGIPLAARPPVVGADPDPRSGDRQRRPGGGDRAHGAVGGGRQPRARRGRCGHAVRGDHRRGVHGACRVRGGGRGDRGGAGGRLDATSVIPSRVTALTSVGLEHHRVARRDRDRDQPRSWRCSDHSTLVVGVVGDDVEELAERFATERGASLVRAEPGRASPCAPRAFQRRNFAVALAAARAVLGTWRWGRGAGGGRARAPGRLEREGDPPAVLDAAHNPQAAALAEALPRSRTGGPSSRAWRCWRRRTPNP